MNVKQNKTQIFFKLINKTKKYFLINKNFFKIKNLKKFTSAVMITLGIEGSANKIGVGITEGKNILANPRRTYIPESGKGFAPTEVMEHHERHILDLIKEALTLANLRLKDIDCIAYTMGPGIAAPLNVCAIVARVLALKLNIMIKPVNHCVAHIEMGRMVTGAKNPIILYASGGNTQIISYQRLNIQTMNSKKDASLTIKSGRYAVIGEALDVAVGNCLDRIARLLRISNDPTPGYNIEQYAKKGKKYYFMPVPVKGMNISCSGIISYIKNTYLPKNDDCEISLEKKYDLCYSLQESLFSALVEVTERALSYFNNNEVLIVGGVGCNLRLQEMISIMIKERGGVVYAMDDRYCIDNGAMIAYTGSLDQKNYSIEDCTITQRYRTESVNITWRE